MILLPPENKILAEAIAAKLVAPEAIEQDDGSMKATREPMDVTICDFDDVQYNINIDINNTDELTIHMSCPCLAALKKYVQSSLVKVYGDLVMTPKQGFDVSLKVDLTNLPEKTDDLVSKLALIKANAIGSVFDTYFQALLDGKPLTENFRFHLRNDTEIFFVPRNDRVTIVYGVDFKEKTDQVIARVFLQEFVDARRRLTAAPSCAYSVNPPLELKEFGITEPTGNLGFVSFAVMKSNIEQGRKDKVIGVLTSFRNYLQYHLKCSKSYFHSRMRARVSSLLKVLNRAKVEVPADKKEMKTFSGKTFTRQV